MDISDQPESQPVKKESIKRFVLRATAPFRVETEALGPITARRMTASGAITFAQRMKSLDEAGDEEVVRAYIGSVSSVPIKEEEQLPDPLTEEQVALLTDADVESFSREYLQHIVKPDQVLDDPISQLADYIRQERNELLKSTKKLADSISASLKIGATADYLKNWQELSKSVAGPMESLREEMRRMLGPIGSMRASVGDALRDLSADRASALSAFKQFDAQIAFPERATSRDYYEPLRMPEFPPIEESPIGRTATAVEELSRAGQRMEEAMGMVVEQAGNVSEKMGQVLTKIETESAKSQRAARWALFIGGVSLVVSAVALGASAYFSHAGYWADREDARSDGQAAQKLTEQVGQQAAALQALASELRKSYRPSPEAPVQPAKQAGKSASLQPVEQPSKPAPAAPISSIKPAKR